MKVSFQSPVVGDLLPITETLDDVFSKKLLGDGFAIYPMESSIVSPIYGKVKTIYPTEHIIIIEHSSCHVMLHLGLKSRDDIVSWQVKVGDSLSKGEPIGALKMNFFKQAEAFQVINVVFLETKTCTFENGNVTCDE